MERFFKEARDSRCEGIMVKTLDHHWQTGAATGAGTSSSKDEKVKTEEEPQDDESNGEQLQALGDVVSDELDMAEDDEQDDNNVTIISPGTGVTGRGKALLSTYEPDKRCESWLKVKQDYVDGLGDSLDLVPIGAWHGMGRKANWWSPVLLAVYDEESGGYQAVCKCISGFTDNEYKSIKFERFAESEEPGASCYNARKQRCRQEYDTGGYLPDVWWVGASEGGAVATTVADIPPPLSSPSLPSPSPTGSSP